jgi:N-acetylneuraminate synthase/sialic acid synthase
MTAGIRRLQIGDRTITDEADCFVIAEIGHNHQGSVAQCKEMITIAKTCGVDAVKLQKRDNRTLFTRAAYDAPYDHENSYGRTYGEHREALEFNKDQYLEVQKHAESLGLIFFSTRSHRATSPIHRCWSTSRACRSRSS